MLIDMTPKPAVVKVSDIGTTVQAYDINMISDEFYVHTDNNFDNEAVAKLAHVPDDTNYEISLIDSTKQDTLISTQNIRSINGESILGNGDLVIAAGSGGFAADLYLTNAISTIEQTYKTISYTPDSESVIEQGICNSGETLVNVYLFDLHINTTIIDAGKWSSSFYAESDHIGSYIRIEGFMKDINNNESTLFSVNSTEIPSSASYVVFESIEPVHIVEPTSVYGVRVFIGTASSIYTTVKYTVGGSQSSYTNTPLATRHSQLRARDESGAHPMSAISGLIDHLDTKVDAVQSTNNAIVIFNGVNGNIKDSLVIINDGNITTPGTINNRNIITDGNKLDLIEAGAEVNDVKSVSGRIGDILLTKSDVGLNNVENILDKDKVISDAALVVLSTKADKSEIVGITDVKNIAMTAVGAITHDMTGFENRTDSFIAFDESTRTFTVSPVSASATYYSYGKEIHITEQLSFVIPDISGGLYINLNATSNTLYNGGPHGGILTEVLCGYIYWDAVNQKTIIFGDERHSASADTQWHYSQHRDVGAIWRSGGGLNYTLDDDTAISLIVGTPMTIADEDLEHIITDSTDGLLAYSQILSGQAHIPVIYLQDTSYVQISDSLSHWIAGTSTASINSINNNIGYLMDAGEGKFISYWMLATNDSKAPIKLLLGRIAFDSVDEAYAETYDSYGLDVSEHVPMYHIVLQTSESFVSVAKVKIAGVRLIAQRIVTSSSAFSATSHDALTGRSLSSQHPIESITYLKDSLDVKQISIVYGATRLIQTQRIMAQMVLRGQI